MVSEFIGFERFIMNFLERRNPIVPFQQSRGVAHLFDSMRVHLPNRVEHRMIVGVEGVFFKLRMAGDVDLAHPMVRNVV